MAGFVPATPPSSAYRPGVGANDTALCSYFPSLQRLGGVDGRDAHGHDGGGNRLVSFRLASLFH
jgi:hypothetical protein